MPFECEPLIVRTTHCGNNVMIVCICKYVPMMLEDLLTFQQIVSAHAFPPPRRTTPAPRPMACSPHRNLDFSGGESSVAEMNFSLIWTIIGAVVLHAPSYRN